jgi:hypothetical protein
VGHKLLEQDAQQGRSIANGKADAALADAASTVLFTGWCHYGYWLNGELLNRREYRDRFYKAPVVVKTQWKRETERELRKSPYRKHTSQTAQEARGEILSEWLSKVPTLEDWKSL